MTPNTRTKAGTAAPFLKWAGGKHQLLDELVPLVPGVRGHYVEPFVGGGALFFAMRPVNSVLCDANEELINAYTVVRDDVNALIEVLGRHVNEERYFYEIRSQDPGALDEVERASRLIYLNRTCFNGLYRVNQDGEFNVPFANYANPTICQTEVLEAASLALQGTDLVAGDFVVVLEAMEPGDFAYLDPPYLPAGGYADFRRYHRTPFSTDDQQRLADWFGELDFRGCRVMASNSYTEATPELYKGWNIRKVEARRNINSSSEGRGAVAEAVITNF